MPKLSKWPPSDRYIAWLSSVVSPSSSLMSATRELRGRASWSSAGVAFAGFGSQHPRRTLNSVMRNDVIAMMVAQFGLIRRAGNCQCAAKAGSNFGNCAGFCCKSSRAAKRLVGSKGADWRTEGILCWVTKGRGTAIERCCGK